jgi:hypothetical protein
MSQLTKRFQKVRWSPIRRKVDAMKPGETLELPERDYISAKSAVERCNEAYGRERPKWRVRVCYNLVIVTHGTPH